LNRGQDESNSPAAVEFDSSSIAKEITDSRIICPHSGSAASDIRRGHYDSVQQQFEH
jgi:hypothetical protein